MVKHKTLGSSVLLAIVGAALIVVGLVFQFAVYPSIHKTNVRKASIVNNGNILTQDWIQNRYNFQVEYYLFNYTNGLEVVQGGFRPDAYQVGPYTYTQKRQIQYNQASYTNDSTIFDYGTKSIFEFAPDKSCLGCSPRKNKIRIPDPVFFGFWDAFFISENFYIWPQVLDIIGIPLYGYNATPFITVTIEDLIMNTYESPFEKMLRSFRDMISDKSVLEVFDMLLQNVERPRLNMANNTLTDSLYLKIKTGADQAGDIGQIVGLQKDNQEYSSLPEKWWNGYNTTSCNGKSVLDFKGTNGELFGPAVKNSDTLYAYFGELCRFVPLTYTGKTKVGKLDTLRFGIAETAFDYSADDNCGYCQVVARPLLNHSAYADCLPNGVLNVTGCKGKPLGAWTLMSNPHFLYGDPGLLETMPRLRADPKEHRSVLDIEPQTGRVLASQRKLQFNFLAGHYPTSFFEAIYDGVYPLAWYNETMTATTATLEDIQKIVEKPVNTVKIVCLTVGVGLGVILLIISGIVFGYGVWKNSKINKTTPIPKRTATNASANAPMPPDLLGSALTRRNRPQAT